MPHLAVTIVNVAAAVAAVAFVFVQAPSYALLVSGGCAAVIFIVWLGLRFVGRRSRSTARCASRAGRYGGAISSRRRCQPPDTGVVRCAPRAVINVTRAGNAPLDGRGRTQGSDRCPRQGTFRGRSRARFLSAGR